MTTSTTKDCRSDYKISFKREDFNFFVDLSGEFGLKNLTAFAGDIKREISSQKVQNIAIDFQRSVTWTARQPWPLFKLRRRPPLKKSNAG